MGNASLQLKLIGFDIVALIPSRKVHDLKCRGKTLLDGPKLVNVFTETSK